MSHCAGNLVTQCTVGLSVRQVSLTEPKAVDMTQAVQPLSNFWKKNMTVQIFTKKEKRKKEQCSVHQLFLLCVTEHVSDFPLSNSNHKPMWRGESAPVCVKNRTRYYRGISKRPVKIKGFREVLRSSFGHCQHFFGVCCLMWSVKNCFLFEEQHVTSQPTQE